MILRTLFFCIPVIIVLNNVLISAEGVSIFRKDYTYNEKFSSFYKLHTVSNTWVNAKLKCQQEGAVLFYPETKEEAAYVLNTFYKYYKGWIGISDLLADREFETVTGVSAETVYCNWETNTWEKSDESYLYQQNKYNGIGMTKINEEKHCVTLNSMTNMELMDCNSTHRFLCKKTLNSIVWNDDCNMADSKYVYNSNFDKCYKFNLRPMDWMTAHSMCIAEQSHLAIINSQEEADFLVNMTRDAPKNRYRGPYLEGAVHLGFHNIFRDGYSTVKGYPLIESGYTKWSYSQPDNAGDGEELCGSMFYNGELNDIHCTDICYFICEHDIAKPKTTGLEVRSAENHQATTDVQVPLTPW